MNPEGRVWGGEGRVNTRVFVSVFALLVVGIMLAGCTQAQPSPIPSAPVLGTPIPTATPAPTLAPTIELPTATPTAVLTPTPSPSGIQRYCQPGNTSVGSCGPAGGIPDGRYCDLSGGTPQYRCDCEKCPVTTGGCVALCHAKPSPTIIVLPTIGNEVPTKEFYMVAKQGLFEPDVLMVKGGDRVTIHLSSSDTLRDLVLAKFDVNLVAQPNGDVRASFLADTIGNFTFACKDYCGTGTPAKGTLVVEP